jgi:hypothetical protein
LGAAAHFAGEAIVSATWGYIIEKRAAILQRLERDWEKWRGTRAFPARESVDPVKLRYILGNFSLVEVLYDPMRFRFRLHATSSVERLGIDLTGKYIDEAMPDTPARAIVLDNLRQGVERRTPLWICHERMMANKVYGRVEILLLPFSSDGQTIDLLGLGTYFNHAERHQKTPIVFEVNRT